MANAGPDFIAAPGSPAALQGSVAFSGTLPSIQWRQYSGPGTVAFGDATATNTTATFSAPGIYTLELSAADGVHAVAYDAVVVNVNGGILLSIDPNGGSVNLSWVGGIPPYVIQSTSALPGNWSTLATTSAQSISVPVTNNQVFFRIQSQ